MQRCREGQNVCAALETQPKIARQLQARKHFKLKNDLVANNPKLFVYCLFGICFDTKEKKIAFGLVIQLSFFQHVFHF